MKKILLSFALCMTLSISANSIDLVSHNAKMKITVKTSQLTKDGETLDSLKEFIAIIVTPEEAELLKSENNTEKITDLEYSPLYKKTFIIDNIAYIIVADDNNENNTIHRSVQTTRI